MGFFDKLAAESKIKNDVEKVKNEVKELFLKRVDLMNILEQKPNYASALQLKREEVVNQFTDFFMKKDFLITHKKSVFVQGVNGAEAQSGDNIVSLEFYDKYNFQLLLPGVFTYDFSLVDEKSEKILVVGTEHEGDVMLLGEYSGGDFNTLNRAKVTLQEENEKLEKSINENYAPDIKIYYGKNDYMTDDFTVYLEEINKDLE